MADHADDAGWIKPRRATADLIVAVGLLALGAGFVRASAGLELGKLDMPGAGLFPLLAAGALVVVALAMIAGELRSLRAAGAETVTFGHAYSGTAAAALILLSLTFEWVGFPLTAFILLFALFHIFAAARPFTSLMTAAVLSGAIYLVFTRLFGIELPLGALLVR